MRVHLLPCNKVCKYLTSRDLFVLPVSVNPHSGVLVRQSDEERREHFQNLLHGLTNFSKELAETPGPTFLADGQLSNVDLALIPWAYRYYVFEHYRGPDYVIPQTPELEAYHQWFDHVMNLDSVRRKDRWCYQIALWNSSDERFAKLMIRVLYFLFCRYSARQGPLPGTHSKVRRRKCT